MTGKQSVLGGYVPYLAMLMAWVAMGGSLYFSEVLRWPPCTLCWWQRGFMYPLTLIIPASIILRWRNMHRLILPMVIIGGCISAYHYAEIMFPALIPPAPCAPDSPPCTMDLLRAYTRIDWLAIPLLAFTAFTLIGISMAIFGRARPWEPDEDDDETDIPELAQLQR